MKARNSLARDSESFCLEKPVEDTKTLVFGRIKLWRSCRSFSKLKGSLHRRIGLSSFPLSSPPLSLLLDWSFFVSFLCFILLFWNHIFTWNNYIMIFKFQKFLDNFQEGEVFETFQKLTCLSLSCRLSEISCLLFLVRYLLKWNSFSNSNVCVLEYVCLVLLLSPPFVPVIF